jgi:response regulator of citrate/malate metabolism
MKEHKQLKNWEILREALRHYPEYQAYISQYGGDGVIEYAGVSLSFHDIKNGLNELSPRKKEAIFYNVIMDLTQEESGKRMGISAVSIGQYVKVGMKQLSREYFKEEKNDSNN